MTKISLSGLNIYPLKSAKAIRLQSSRVEEKGLLLDRRWVVTDQQGQFITGRTQPKLALIVCRQTESGIIFSAPDMPDLILTIADFPEQYTDVTVWGTAIRGQRCSAQADRWLSNWLGVDCQLCYFGEHSQRKVKNTDKTVGFADGYPLLLISQASLDELNRRCSKSIAMSQFRPNLVVEGCEPFAEDGWKRIKIGDAEFEIVKPCVRCIFTTLNPDSTEYDNQREPLTTLSRFRQDEKGHIDFGQNLLALNDAEIKLGDKLTVLEYQEPKTYPDADAGVEQEPSADIEPSADTEPSAVEKSSAVSAHKDLTIQLDSWDKSFQGNNQSTLLEQAEDNGVALPYNCRAGFCGMCKVVLEAGQVKTLADHALSPEDKDAGHVLACSCIPETDVVIRRT